jgi:hypothetical protein
MYCTLLYVVCYDTSFKLCTLSLQYLLVNENRLLHIQIFKMHACMAAAALKAITWTVFSHFNLTPTSHELGLPVDEPFYELHVSIVMCKCSNSATFFNIPVYTIVVNRSNFLDYKYLYNRLIWILYRWRIGAKEW